MNWPAALREPPSPHCVLVPSLLPLAVQSHTQLVGGASSASASSRSHTHEASNPEQIDVSTALETLAGTLLATGASMALVRTELLSYFQSTSPLPLPSLDVSRNNLPASSHVDAAVSMSQAPTVSSVLLPTTAELHAWRLQLTPAIVHALIDGFIRANQPAGAWDLVQQMFMPVAGARLKADGITLHWMSVICAKMGQVRTFWFPFFLCAFVPDHLSFINAVIMT